MKINRLYKSYKNNNKIYIINFYNSFNYVFENKKFLYDKLILLNLILKNFPNDIINLIKSFFKIDSIKYIDCKLDNYYNINNFFKIRNFSNYIRLHLIRTDIFFLYKVDDVNIYEIVLNSNDNDRFELFINDFNNNMKIYEKINIKWPIKKKNNFFYLKLKDKNNLLSNLNILNFRFNVDIQLDKIVKMNNNDNNYIDLTLIYFTKINKFISF